MENVEIVAWVAQHQGYWIKLYGLEQWDIQISVDEDEEADLAGECVSDFEYRWAEIVIYSENISSEAELEETLCHELEHVLLSPFSTAYDKFLSSMVPKAKRALVLELMAFMEEQARNMVGQMRVNLICMQDPPVLEPDAAPITPTGTASPTWNKSRKCDSAVCGYVYPAAHRGCPACGNSSGTEHPPLASS